MIANLLLPVLSMFAQKTKANFIQKTRHCLKLQEQFLLNLLQVNKHTELGKKYQLKNTICFVYLQFGKEFRNLRYSNNRHAFVIVSACAIRSDIELSLGQYISV